MDRVDLGVGVAGIYVRDQDEAIDFMWASSVLLCTPTPGTEITVG